MIKINQLGEVLQIKMGREVNGEIPYVTTAYLVDGLLIDTGPSNTASELAEVVQGRYLKVAVNTHYHEDHIGGNATLMRHFGIRILASPVAAPVIKRGPYLYEMGREAWGAPEPTEVDCLPERLETDHFCFDVVDTPGHCHGHVSLVEPTKGWCFCGDLYVPWEPTRCRPEDEDLGETVSSMQKLIRLQTDELVLFTSVGRVVQDGRAALRSRIQYYRDMRDRAIALEREGLSVAAIRERLFGEESPVAEATGGGISSQHFVRALLRADI